MATKSTSKTAATKLREQANSAMELTLAHKDGKHGRKVKGCPSCDAKPAPKRTRKVADPVIESTKPGPDRIKPAALAQRSGQEIYNWRHNDGQSWLGIAVALNLTTRERPEPEKKWASVLVWNAYQKYCETKGTEIVRKIHRGSQNGNGEAKPEPEPTTKQRRMVAQARKDGAEAGEEAARQMRARSKKETATAKLERVTKTASKRTKETQASVKAEAAAAQEERQARKATDPGKGRSKVRTKAARELDSLDDGMLALRLTGARITWTYANKDLEPGAALVAKVSQVARNSQDRRIVSFWTEIDKAGKANGAERHVYADQILTIRA